MRITGFQHGEGDDGRVTPAVMYVIGGKGLTIMGLIIVLLVVWLAFVIVGFAVKALLWLAIVGIVLFVATGIYGAIRSRTS
jgi:hypothetical protein